MTKAQITRNRIDELLRFLPKFGTPGPDTEPTWPEMECDAKTGVFVMTHPIYPPEVEEFYRLAGQPCWNDYEYDPTEAGRMVRNDEMVASASLAQIKTMLTFCVRGERFCDGHWAAVIREGRIAAILHRLQQLRETVQ